MEGTIISTLVLSLTVSATIAFGGVKEENFTVTPIIGGHIYDGSQGLDPSIVVGARAGYNITKAVGVEALYDYVTNSNAPSASLTNISLQRFGGQALYHFTPTRTVVPYLAAGYALIKFSGQGVNEKITSEFGYGAGFKYFLTDDIAVRGDIRHFLYEYNSKIFNNGEVTLGAYYQFGRVIPASKLLASATEQNPSSEQTKTVCVPVACVPVYCAPVACIPAPEAIRSLSTPLTLSDCEPLWVATEAKAAAIAAAEAATQVCKKPEQVSVLYGPNRLIFSIDFHDELDKVGVFLKKYPKSRVTIAGYTDADGTKEENLELSVVRAAVARSGIIYKFKIDRNRISIKGYGSANPVASNRTETGRAKNRRIEFIFDCK
jgi:OmpA-OmpF porin, OOP family